MGRPFSSAAGAVVRHLRRQLLAGLVIAAPLVVTYLLLRFLFVNMDAILGPVFIRTLGRDVPGVGVAALVVLLYFLGLLATNFVGRALIRQGEGMLLKIPILKEVYGPARDTVQALSKAGQSFRGVVLVEYPRKGIISIGFVTGGFRDPQGQELVVVYFPSTPFPTSGFIAMFPAADVQDAGISVDAALRLFASGGLVPAQELRPVAS
jgi:uncharacterized membrane protein